MDPDDTNSLFKRYHDGEGDDKERFERYLYERGKQLCMAIYWNRFRDVPIEDAEDLFHEALLYALDKGDPKKNFRALLCIVFVNKTLDWLRDKEQSARAHSGKKRPGTEEKEFWQIVLERESPAAPSDFESREHLEHALACIQALPDRQRRAMQLFLEGMKLKDITLRVVGSAKDLLYHARANIRRCLRERFGWLDEDFLRYCSP